MSGTHDFSTIDLLRLKLEIFLAKPAFLFDVRCSGDISIPCLVETVLRLLPLVGVDYAWFSKG